MKPVKQKIKTKAIRKTYTFTENDLNLIEEIKDKLLNHKCVVTDSQVIRMGLAALASHSESNLVKIAQGVPTLFKKSKI